MTFIKDAISRMLALSGAGFPKPPTTQPEIQRQLHKLDQHGSKSAPVEDLLPFLTRARQRGAPALRRFELNRVLRGAWCDGSSDDLGAVAVTRAEREQKRSSDQAVIEGY